MKKVAFAFVITFLFSLNVNAELYHGIDIDNVFAQSDWSSKDKIKEVIDDYSLLLQYKNELKQCISSDSQLNCMDELTQNIMKHFYSYNYENNIHTYQNYVTSTSAVYGVAYCLNKYNIPSGNICEQEKNTPVNKIIKQYIKTLLSQIEKQISAFSFIKDYK